MKENTCIKIMTISLMVFSSLIAKAQSENDVAYYYVENLTSESYSNWVLSLEKLDDASVVYACVPANILGVMTSFEERFKLTIAKVNLRAKRVQITKKEALEKCASKRKL